MSDVDKEELEAAAESLASSEANVNAVEIEAASPTRTEPVPPPHTEHTAKNTCADELIEAVWLTMAPDPNELSGYPIFLGTKKADFLRNITMMNKWVKYRAAEQSLELGKIPESQYMPIKHDYEEYRKKHFEHLDDKQFNEFFDSLIQFSQDTMEDWQFRSETNYEREYTNRTKFADGLIEADCQPRFPKAGGKFSFAQRMERSSSRSSSDPLCYDTLVRDSLVQLRIARTTLLELGDLISEINREITGYVRRLNGNSLTLARVAMYRVFWKHLMSKITSCSVKGISDWRELGSIIKFNNLNEIFVKFIQEVSRSGAQFTLYCTEDKCGWQDTQTIDPSILKNFDPSLLDRRQAAAIANIRNGVKTYSKEEILKLQKLNIKKLIPEDRIYFDNQRQYIRVMAPTVNEAFASYDVFMQMMEPRIDKLREDYIDDEQYLTQLNSLLDTYRSMEFIHWVGELHIITDSGEEEIFRRSDDPVEFVNGIIPILNKQENTQLSTDLIKFVLSNAAKMVTTVVGVPNYICPKCAESSGKHVGVKGITPVDPFTCFFILSRLAMAKRQVQMNIEEEVL